MDKSILIVDDDKRVTTSLKQVLENEGYSVKTAETGQEAIEKSKTQFFNFALLDIKLPDMEGTELLKILHERVDPMYPKVRGTIKIMITGHATLDNAIESVNLGADGYFRKPVQIQSLLKALEEKARIQLEEEVTSDLIDSAFSILLAESKTSIIDHPRIRTHEDKAKTSSTMKKVESSNLQQDNVSPAQEFWYALANSDFEVMSQESRKSKNRRGNQ